MGRVTITKYDTNTGKYLGVVSVTVNQPSNVTVRHPGYTDAVIYVTPDQFEVPVNLTPRFAIL